MKLLVLYLLPSLAALVLLTPASLPAQEYRKGGDSANQQVGGRPDTSEPASETPFQTLRGRVIDAVSERPLAGAKVILGDTSDYRLVYTNQEGRFRFQKVATGRHRLQVFYTGYEVRRLPGVLVNAGKETVLTVRLQESLLKLDEIEITDQKPAGDAANKFASVSAREFSSEQAARYAGSLNDPSRMATNFASATSANDTRNDIVVRGNSPNSLLWRLEGLDIPNPNHFGFQGTNGGPVSILNNNTLASSDFFAGAFPAQYGNAVGAVFDLAMRKGNAEQYEHAFQVGFNGLQLRSEGPISEKPNSSYLVSYRYSTLAVMDALGFSFGDLQGVPEFQDIAFKVQSQLGPGVLSVFGIGGISNIDILESELSAQAWDDLETPYFRDVRSEARMGVGGASYKLPVGEEGLLALTVGLSEESRHNDVDTLSLDQEPRPLYDEHYSSWDAQAHLQYTHKFGARHNLRAGVHVRQAMLDMQDSLWLYGPTPARQVSLHNIEESYTLTQAYAQWQSRITQGLTATAGLRGMHLSIDGQRSLSPRAGLQWQAARRHTFSAGYGLHHQMQPVPVYYTLDSEGNTPNASLDFTRSQHAILGYDFRPSADWRLRVESYYQWLDQVPVRATPSAYALLNSGANFNRLPDYTDLENEGTGRNLGLELTVEKFLAQGWYALLTGSLFDARYTASDGEQHPTAFDKGYATNLLLGTEQPVGPKQANQIFGDVRAVTSGGFRYTPVDKQASQAAGRPIYQEAPFAGQMRPYFRLDVKLGYRQNFAQISQEFSLTLQNVTNHQNIFTRDYDPRTNSIIERNQLGFFPVMRYKLLF